MPRTYRPVSDARKETFLQELATHGIVARAALAASPGASERWCAASTFRRLRQQDPDFATRWEEAVEQANGRIENELYRRAVEGWDEPTFYHGEPVGQVRKYSDRLLEVMAKARLSGYRDAPSVAVQQNNVAIPQEELTELMKKLSREGRQKFRDVIQEIQDLRGNDHE